MDETYGGGAVKPDVKPPDEKPGNEPPESVDKQNEEAGAKTALISNKILSPEGQPLKEGDEVVLKVVKNYGDESEVVYAPHKPGEQEGESAGSGSDSNMDTVGNELSAMSGESE